MVNVNRLKGVIVENGKTQADIAKMLGITERTFYSKMKRKVFDSDEIYEMCRYLSINDADMVSIFFDPDVT